MSYEQAAQDVAYFSRICVPAKTQHLVHRQNLAMPNVDAPIEELCVDGGKVHLRTAPTLKSEWRDYKAIATDQGTIANFHHNAHLLDWVNAQPLVNPVVCLGDGHDGVWNIVTQITTLPARREILDWYHLKENLHKIGGSIKRLNRAEAFLWKGQVDEAIALFQDSAKAQAKNFCKYVRKYQHRIVNYDYFQRCCGFVQSVLVRLSPLLNRLTVVFKYLGHSGMLPMFLKC